MADSTAASSSLFRPKSALVFVTGVAAFLAVAGILVHTNVFVVSPEEESGLFTEGAHVDGLVRRGAIRRRRQQNNHDADSASVDPTEHLASINDLLPETRASDDTFEHAETVIDERQEFDWETRPRDGDTQRRGQNIVSLLFRVSEDATRRNAYVHRGCMCNQCGDIIRGIRYSCTNCVDYDLCEPCESQNSHHPTHVFLKIRVPIANGLARGAQPVMYPGDPEAPAARQGLNKALVQRLMKETAMEKPEIDAMFEIFTFSASEEWRNDPDGIGLAMSRDNFDRCLVPAGNSGWAGPSLLHDRMFAFFDTNNDGRISFPEYVNGAAFRKQKDRIKRIFSAYDLDGDGFVSRKDFLRMFRALYMNAQQRQRDMIESLADHCLTDAAGRKVVTSGKVLSSYEHFTEMNSEFPDPRPAATGIGSGKQRLLDGDLGITDDKGIVLEDGKDTGRRDDIVIDEISHGIRDRLQRLERDNPLFQVTTTREYWDATVNPPTNAEGALEAQRAIIESIIRNRGRNAALAEDHARQERSTAPSREQEQPDAAIQEFRDVISTGASLVNTLLGQGEQFAAPLEPGAASAEHTSDHSADTAAELNTLGDENSVLERYPGLNINDELPVIDARDLGTQSGDDYHPVNASNGLTEDTATHIDTGDGADELPMPWTHSRPERALPTFVDDEDVKIVCGERCDRDNFPSLMWDGIVGRARERHLSAGNVRQPAHEFIHERWQRRQFYTDEEEGAGPPPDWAPDEELDYTEDKSKHSDAHLSQRSRSSSKVRFADDDDFGDDDYSVWSGSSRRTSERWGDFEISRAERDAGKEILYQTTQHALNELLDILFREKEDKGVEAMSNKSDRDDEHLKKVYTSKHFESWAKQVDSSQSSPVDDDLETTATQSTKPFAGKSLKVWEKRPRIPVVELQDVRQLPIDHLLAASGYSIEGQSAPTLEAGGNAAASRDGAMEIEEEDKPDPTMPQNRPTSIPEPSTSALPPVNHKAIDDLVDSPLRTMSSDTQPEHKPESRPLKAALETAKELALEAMAADGMESEEVKRIRRLDWAYLYTLRNGTLLEEESIERGGWGRLSGDEVETIVKEREAEMERMNNEGVSLKDRGPNLDYLGSWIHLILP